MDDTRSSLPKVSVLVVTYNQQDTIARTLNSILNQQTDFPFEIEIADDCSTDCTGDICREYVRQYPTKVRYTRNKVNLGVRENYFRALHRCRALYVADCAGDDYWVDEFKLRKQVKILDDHPEVGLVHTAWCHVDETTGDIIPADPNNEYRSCLKPFCKPGELLEAVYTKRMLIHWCTALYRKCIFEEAEKADPYPFHDKEITFEDFQLSVVYARNAWIAYLPDITMHYTIGHESITHTRNRLKEFDFLFSLTKLKQHFAQECHISDTQLNAIYRQSAAFLYSMAFIDFDHQRMDAVNNFYKDHDMPRPMKCRIMYTLSHIPILGRTAAQIKKIHHYWRLQRWD